MAKIKYIITNEIYFEAKELHPQPLKDFIPNWLKKVPNTFTPDSVVPSWSRKMRNVRACPSFVDIYKEGHVLLAPTDIKIWYEKENDIWYWRTPFDLFPDEPEATNITIHEDEQMKNHLPSAAKTKLIFKVNYPMFMDVPRGYGIRVLPVPYHYQNDWRVTTGVFTPSNVSQANLLFEFISDKDEILIKQGTPLAVHLPYKKEKHSISTELYNPKKHNKLKYKNVLLINGRFHSSYLRNIKDND
tara:strand:- start:6388 stop:7119 length:732 start_codon:yes stop_codon:yes gene_type:complete